MFGGGGDHAQGDGQVEFDRAGTGADCLGHRVAVDAGHGEAVVEEHQVEAALLEHLADVLVVAGGEKPRVGAGVPPRTGVHRHVAGLHEPDQRHVGPGVRHRRLTPCGGQWTGAAPAKLGCVAMASEPGRSRQRYPHPTSILRYSRIVHELLADGTVSGSMPVLADQLDAGGLMRLGALAPLVDSCAGLLAARAVHPDWCATLDFKLHLVAPPASGAVHGLARPLRVGTNTVLSDNHLVDDAGRPVGVAHVTFSRLPSRPGTTQTEPPRPVRFDYTHRNEEPRLPFDEYFGLRFEEGLAFELDHHERIYNSFGSIQGGAMAALLERGVALAAERLLGAPASTVDLHFSYLAQAVEGPFRVVAEPVRVEGGAVLSTVELIDTARDRRCAVGTGRAEAIVRGDPSPGPLPPC